MKKIKWFLIAFMAVFISPVGSAFAEPTRLSLSSNMSVADISTGISTWGHQTAESANGYQSMVFGHTRVNVTNEQPSSGDMKVTSNSTRTHILAKGLLPVHAMTLNNVKNAKLLVGKAITAKVKPTITMI